MFLVFALALPLLIAAFALAADKNRAGKSRDSLAGRPFRASGPLQTFLKNYAFALATSLALAYILATDIFYRIPFFKFVTGEVGVLDTVAQEAYGFLILANLLALLTFAAARGRLEFRKPMRSFAVWAALFAVFVLFRLSFYWAFYQFPLQDANMVFGVLAAPLGDAPTAFAKLWAKKALLPSIFVSAGLMPALLSIRNLGGRATHLVPALVAAMLALTFFGVSGNVPLKDYYSAGKALDVSTAYSSFYKQHYVFPDSVNITAPKEKRNLLFIYLESMEVSFQDSANGGLHKENFIPEISELAKENLNFSGGQPVGGGIDLTGTGWTISATVAKFMGVPMLTPPHSNGHVLQNAVGLTDILARAGYNQRYVIGSTGTMFNRTAILGAHGVLTKDDKYFEREGHVPDKHFINYGFAETGFADSKLYGFVKQELDSLSKLGQPFNLITLTTDTHFKRGWHDAEACPDFAPAAETDEEIFKAAVRCASKQLGDFIAWVKTQEWFKNTVVVIVGDHTWPSDLFIPKDHLVQQKIYNEHVTHQEQNDLYRRWVCIYMNAVQKPATRFRQYSSFDIFPTTLEALGFEIEGHALGFGRSLFSNRKTLVEEFGEALVNRNFTKATPEYLYLLGDEKAKW